MTRFASVLPAAATASLAAGPMFLFTAALFIWLGNIAAPPTAIDPTIFGVIPWSLITVPVGFVLAFLPNLLGTSVLASLGRGNEAMRLPVVWAMTGGLGTTLMVAAIGQASSNNPIGQAFVATGAISALLCRWKMDWND